MRPRQTRASEFKRFIKRLGFSEVSQSGSHKKFRHADGRIVIVADHPGDIPTGTLRAMIESIGMTTEQFNREI